MVIQTIKSCWFSKKDKAKRRKKKKNLTNFDNIWRRKKADNDKKNFCFCVLRDQETLKILCQSSLIFILCFAISPRKASKMFVIHPQHIC